MVPTTVEMKLPLSMPWAMRWPKRVVAANPRTFPRWWLSVAVVLANGHPERLRGCCERILAHAGVAFDRHATYAEEVADRPMREAARHWQDRDLTDDLAGDED